MAAVENLIAEGIVANVAKQIGLDIPATGLTATGSNQAGALTLASNFAIFSTVAASTGCIANASQNSFIYNGGANALSVYPPLGMNINGTAANAAISVPANKGVFLMPARNLTIAAIVSA